MLQKIISRAGLACALLALAAVTGPAEASELCGSEAQSPEGPPFNPEHVCASYPPHQNGPITNPDMQDPTQGAWEIFAELNRPSAAGSKVTVWRTWPEQAEVYPADPQPGNPPQWSKISGEDPLRLRPFSFQQKLRRERGTPQAPAGDHPCASFAKSNSEETRINREAFEYLIAHDLWYVEGKAKRFAENFDVNFPTDAREVKANWIPVDEEDAAKFYTATDSKGQTWGLIAFHILSKETPNWLWATFEHKDDPCYSKYLDAQDPFGLTKDGKVSDRLKRLLRKHGLNVELWSNYRLDGAQVTFTDATGRPIILGNSVTEFGFQTRASCMTCHGRATTDKTGKGFLSIFDEHNQSYSGTPDPSWYFSSFETNPPTRSYLPLDFLWSVALCPNEIGSTKQNCPLPTVDE